MNHWGRKRFNFGKYIRLQVH